MFLAISLPDDKKYSIQKFESPAPDEHRMNILLQANALPPNVNRQIPEVLPFYRIIALSKTLLTGLNVSDWAKAKVYLNLPAGDEILCQAPRTDSSVRMPPGGL